MADRWCFDADGASGKVALYRVPDTDIFDDAPLLNPRANFDRVRFHSDFNYVRVVSDTTHTLTLPTRSDNTRGEQTHTLVAHGRAGIPFVMGAVEVAGRWVPLMISTPVARPGQSGGGGSYYGQWRLLSLGANSTHILVHEFWCVPYFFSGGDLTSHTVNVRVIVTDELL